MKKTIRHSTASYRNKNGEPKCDLVKLAKTYSNVGMIPEKIGFIRATEIALLSQAFLQLYKTHQKEQGE